MKHILIQPVRWTGWDGGLWKSLRVLSFGIDLSAGAAASSRWADQHSDGRMSVLLGYNAWECLQNTLWDQLSEECEHSIPSLSVTLTVEEWQWGGGQLLSLTNSQVDKFHAAGCYQTLLRCWTCGSLAGMKVLSPDVSAKKATGSPCTGFSLKGRKYESFTWGTTTCRVGGRVYFPFC